MTWAAVVPPKQRVFLSTEWLCEHVHDGHGPVPAAYPADRFVSESDTPTFLHAIRVGLGSLDLDAVVCHASLEPEPPWPSSTTDRIRAVSVVL